MLDAQGLAEAQRLAAAATTRPVVRSPGRTLLRQTAAHGWQLGLGALYRLATGLRNVSQRDAPDETFRNWLSRLSGETPAAAASLDESASFVPAAFRFGTAPAPAGIEEGSYWIAYAAGSYARTLPAVVAQLRAGGVRDACPQHVIYSQLEPLPLRQPHFIARDPAKKVIVIAIRGTATLQDVIADSAARPIPFAGGAAHTGMAAAVDGLLHYAVDWEAVNLPLPAHVGVAAGAASAAASGASAGADAAPAEATADAGFSVPFVQGLAQLAAADACAAAGGAAAGAAAGGAGIGSTTAFSPYQVIPDVSAMGLAGVAAILQRALAAYPDHRVVITGHSLGGGVAALLTCRIVRIRLYWHRRHLENLAQQARAQAERDVVGQTGAVVNADPDVAAAMAGKATFETLTPPRPMNCWAYASPACLSPELSAFAALSMADIERFMLQDDAWAAQRFGREVTDRFKAAFERTNAIGERIAAQRRHDAAQPLVSREDSTPWSTDSSSFALEAVQAQARARLDAGPETWPLHTRLPIVSSVVYADDMVPRLTVASLADLAARLQRSTRRDARWSLAAFRSVGLSLQALSCGGRCAWCVAGSPVAAAEAPQDAHPLAPTTPVRADDAGAAPDCASSAVAITDRYSASMQPLAPLEEAEADVAHPLHQAAVATSAAQETVAAGDSTFARRLEATGVPEPVRRAVLRLVASTHPVWVDASQELVAPGCLWLVNRVVTGSTPAAHDAADRQPAVGPSTMVTVGASGASQRQYAIRHVAPVVLRRIVISPTMLTDHMVGEYRACLAVLLPSMGEGEADGGTGAL